MEIPGVPQIPTDNLYKFVSLSGLLMLLVGLAVVPVIRYRAMQADLALLAEHRAASAQRARAIDQLSRSIELGAGANAQGLTGRKEQMDSAWSESNMVAASAQAVRDSVDRNNVESLTHAVEANRDFFASFVWVGYGLALAGGLLATWGFRNWYIKLQKPLDELVLLDAEGRRARLSARE